MSQLFHPMHRLPGLALCWLLAQVTILHFPVLAQSPESSSTTNAENTAIRSTVGSYEQTLNDGSTPAICRLFEDCGVVMVQGSTPKVGATALEGYYRDLFSRLQFHLRFQIEEIAVVSPEWAFARTSTSGTVKLQPRDNALSCAGQELFVLHKPPKSKRWLIARYSASSTH